VMLYRPYEQGAINGTIMLSLNTDGDGGVAAFRACSRTKSVKDTKIRTQLNRAETPCQTEVIPLGR
jgi:hypothetical protein